MTWINELGLTMLALGCFGFAMGVALGGIAFLLGFRLG